MKVLQGVKYIVHCTDLCISVTAAPMKGDKKYISRISKHSGSDVFTEFIEKYIMKLLEGVKSSVH